MITENVILKQQELALTIYINVFTQRNTIKKWCITIWSALFAFTLSDKAVGLNDMKTIILLIIPVIMFWILEGIFGSIEKRISHHLLNIEEILATYNEGDDINPQHIFSKMNEKTTTYRQKISSFIQAIFIESLIVTYLILIIISFLYVFVIK